MNDTPQSLGRLLRQLLEPDTCRHCGCHAGECRIGSGEVCSWAPSVIEKTLCNAPRCLATEAIHIQRDKREAEKKKAAAERAARIPSWVRARAGKRKRRHKGAKARAAA